MERAEAIRELKKLVGKDLYKLALKYNITVFNSDTNKKNKGWAGHVIERYLKLPINSAQSPNFGSWELKVIPIKRLRNGELQFKETMAITMIDPINVIQHPFETSHLYSKLRKIVIVTRSIPYKKQLSPSCVLGIHEIDLKPGTSLYNAVKRDYDIVRQTLKKFYYKYAENPRLLLTELSSEMGVYIQPRTKGAGHGSFSRAFYARKNFLRRIINLENLKQYFVKCHGEF